MDYYFEIQTKRIVGKLDDEVVTHWEDHGKDGHFVKAYVPVFDVVEHGTYIVLHDDFEEDFHLLDEQFFEDWELYDLALDELQVRKLKKFYDALMEQNQN